jgi:disulfide bond formation protein DsbB
METFKTLIPYLALFSDISLVIVFLAVLNRRKWGRKIYEFLGDNSIVIGFAAALGAVLGSLFYSNVVGYEPCELCWWQRVFLYPTVVMLGIAWWKKDKKVFRYIAVFSVLAILVAVYQELATRTGFSMLECTSAGGACSKVYVKEFGYITIPVMSLTASAWLLLVAWVNRIFQNENRNA